MDEHETQGAGADDGTSDDGRSEEPLPAIDPTQPAVPPPFGDRPATEGPATADTDGPATAGPAGAAPEGPAHAGAGWGSPGATWAHSTEPPPPVGHDAATPPPPPPPPSSPFGYGAAPPPVDSGEPTVPSAAWTPAPSAPRAERRDRPALRSALIGGICGALIGALAAGGIVAAVDDNGNGNTIVEAPATNAAARPASVIQSPGDIQSILSKVSPAVVRINVTVNNGLGDSGQGVGTGFVISPDGTIVTNAHVVENAESVQVQLPSGRQVTGRVVGAAPDFDLAVVKINAKNLPTVTLGDSDGLVVGDQVVAIGNALGLEGAPTVTSGIVSGLNRVLVEPGNSTDPNGVDIPNTIQTDAAINPGNSGGPLVDANGNVVGINTAIANPSESNNVGFAIAITPAKRIIAALRKGEQPQVTFLGVGTQAVDNSVKSRFGLKVDQGAYVTSVSNGSGADDAGIKQGDVIVKIGNDAVNNSEDVINDVRRHAPGDSIRVTVDRNGQTKTFSVKLGTRPGA
jgi:S1-C subfamily serine protease